MKPLIRELKVPMGGEGKYKYKTPATEVAKLFNVHPSTISKLWRTEKWLCKEGYYV